MPSPFPGFDPYLENKSDWASFHAAFIVDLSRTLLDVLPPDFDARTEAHVSIVFPEARKSGEPRTAGRVADVGVLRTPLIGGGGTAVLERPRLATDFAQKNIRLPETVRYTRREQTFIQIIHKRGESETVIAIIELLSPTNKDGRDGTDDYRQKQAQLLRTPAHLVEIDLLRGGEHVAHVPKGEIAAFGDWNYLVTLRDATDPGTYRFWRIGLRDVLPTILLPLTPGVAPVPLSLQEAFDRCYDASRLARRLDYSGDPEPPLSLNDAAWADDLLKAAGFQ